MQFPNGQSQTHETDMSGHVVITAESAQLEGNVSITDDAGSSSDSDEIEITLNKCGCTDSLADNYVSTADTEDGTCVYSGCSYAPPDWRTVMIYLRGGGIIHPQLYRSAI